MHEALHLRYNIDWLCVLKKGGRGLNCIDECVDAIIQRYEEYTKKKQGTTNYSSQQ